jgi:hypothetical protein
MTDKYAALSAPSAQPRGALLKRLLCRCLALAMLSIAYPLGASAESFDFLPGASYDWGYNPSIASTTPVFLGCPIGKPPCSKTALVEVHNGSDIQSGDQLWFHVGTINNLTRVLTWNMDAEPLNDSGWNPSVAMSGTTVVEMDNNDAGTAMDYHLGELVQANPDLPELTVNWIFAAPLSGSGWNPSVALSGSTVVEVHNGHKNAFGPMYYRIGTITNGSISWEPTNPPYDSGVNPQVTVLGSTVIEVHNGQNAPGKLWYRVGQITGSTTKTINWNPGGSVPYDWGWNPKISYGPNGLVEVHNGQQTAGQMYYDYGSLSGSVIDWGRLDNQFDDGLNPSVTVFGTGYGALDVHNGGNGEGPEWYNMGEFIYP